jgi:hypothetical protein
MRPVDARDAAARERSWPLTWGCWPESGAGDRRRGSGALPERGCRLLLLPALSLRGDLDLRGPADVAEGKTGDDVV